MTAAIPFAGLAPDARRLRGYGELATFDLVAAANLGRRVCRAAGPNAGVLDVGRELIDALNAYEHHSRPAFALVRLFSLCACGSLDAAAQQRLAEANGRPIPASSLCLKLLVTRGMEAEWNDVARSRAHSEVLVDGNDAPMVSELARQLRHGDPTAPAASTFCIEDAERSVAVPAKDFVRAYGVRSVVGFGTWGWRDQGFVVIGFARPDVPRPIARFFEVVALYARLAWLDTREARSALGPGHTERSLVARDDLITTLGLQAEESLKGHQGRIEQLEAQSKTVSATIADQVEAQAREQRRVQRAMLNVVDDLREARAALERKVQDRTRELQLANAALDTRNRELEEFAYVASHDLQEPLRTIAGYLQLVERRYAGKLGSDGDDFIRFAVDAASRMQQLIESLLTYSRAGTAEQKLSAVKLDETLDLALKNLTAAIAEKKPQIQRSPLPQVRGDAVQLVQVFQNLLSNALKFSGPKPPRVFVTGGEESDHTWVSVRDEGLGFDPKFTDRIFKVFRRLRRDTPGTGIGLSVCKKIVERHGGRIEVVAAPGKGATFTVRFPTQRREP